MEWEDKTNKQPEQTTTVRTIGEAARPADITQAIDEINHFTSSETVRKLALRGLETELNKPQ